MCRNEPLREVQKLLSNGTAHLTEKQDLHTERWTVRLLKLMNISRVRAVIKPYIRVISVFLVRIAIAVVVYYNVLSGRCLMRNLPK